MNYLYGYYFIYFQNYILHLNVFSHQIYIKAAKNYKRLEIIGSLMISLFFNFNYFMLIICLMIELYNQGSLIYFHIHGFLYS